jgi:hypothetical protein
VQEGVDVIVVGATALFVSLTFNFSQPVRKDLSPAITRWPARSLRT